MKQGHLALIFLVIYSICFLFLYLAQEQYDNAQKEKQKVERALIEAAENAGREFTAVINASEEERKQTLEKAFLESLYVSMGLFDTEEKQEYLRMYLPMLILAEEDGAFFFHIQEQQNSAETGLWHVWSEKVPYIYPENSEEDQKKKIVSQTLENIASDIITNHNYIASQYGISYSFFVPTFLLDNSAPLDFPMLFAVFQGWPLTAAGDVVYENCIDVGLYLQEVEDYVVTGPESLSKAICFYHKKSCQYANESTELLCKGYVTEEEAIKKFGAFPCKSCVSE